MEQRRKLFAEMETLIKKMDGVKLPIHKKLFLWIAKKRFEKLKRKVLGENGVTSKYH